MATKKNASGPVGGALVFIGSLIYLYVVFTWISSGGILGPWLSAASFLAPFVAAVAVVSAITLFFMGIGSAAGKMSDEKMSAQILWKFIMIGGVTSLIVTAGGASFYAAVVAFVLTYIGGMMASM